MENTIYYQVFVNDKPMSCELLNEEQAFSLKQLYESEGFDVEILEYV